MFTITKGLVELAASVVILLSIKIQISFWLAATLGIIVLIIGIYSAIMKKLRAIVEIAGAIVLLLPLIPVQLHPAILLPVGILFFIVALSIIVPIFME